MGSVPTPLPSSDVLCQIVTPVGMFGYGFEIDEVYRGLEAARRDHPGVPTALIMDSGSTDSGPSKLALGLTTCPESSYRRDLLACLRIARQYGVPLLLSSAGGDGADAHVRLFGRLVAEAVDALNGEDGTATTLKVLSVYSDVDKALVQERLAAGTVAGCGPCVPALSATAVEATTVVVGQMGPEPFVQAMAAHPDFDVVLGGRAYDPSPYVAFCAYHHLGPAAAATTDVWAMDAGLLGGFTHMGKIMECGGLCATPKSKGSMATVYRDGSFDIHALATGAVCRPLTVAAHTLYEKTRPDQLPGPGGHLDLTTARYAQRDDGASVHVQGATFHPSWSKEGGGAGGAYTIKLEGARITGYRAIFMGSFCDPILLAQLPDVLAQIKKYVGKQHVHLDPATWDLDFHVYDGRDRDGQDAGMPARGGPEVPPPGVAFIVGEALAPTQADANSIASAARIGCVHGSYPGQKANSGNFGMGIGGGSGEIEMGACAEFSVYHLMDLARGEEGAREVGTEGAALFRWAVAWAGPAGGTRVAVPAAVVKTEVKAVNGHTNGASTATSSTTSSTTSSGSTSSKATTTTTATTTTVGDLAKLLRSKNAGPYEITLDVLFDDRAVYDKVKASGVLTPDKVAALYGLTADQLVYCAFFDPALAFKATLPRMRKGQPAASGGFMENDVHGSQKYKPLMNVAIAL
ncbi:hypothetical protein HMPREF1624_06935 [Sporothrix schenckii ATCC 58251]|uniref:Uncharacterized protein n=1 Tax=Sporothrix schenckii (strain ATCC 58251 / de Perez 2211183) TaxID=1391915 RepID=U7PP54_SPOS1|nr:hypothetical protein HMPREF1624_06935 [Sporothrix schenckii ATCC 58251]